MFSRLARQWVPYVMLSSWCKTEEVDGTQDVQPSSKCSHASRCSRYSCTLTVIFLFIIILIESFWLFNLRWQLHSVERYSSSKSVPLTPSHDQDMTVHGLKIRNLDGLSLARDKHYRGSVPTKFMSENKTEADEAWDAIEAGHGDVVIDPMYAAERGLPPTILHPRDPSKLLYIIESYRAIHCLVCDLNCHATSTARR